MDISAIIACCSIHLGTNGHVNPGGENQFNPGIALQVDKWTAGAYYNSDRHIAGLVAYSPFSGCFQPFVGAVSGYKIPVMPSIGAAIVPWKERGPLLTITPARISGKMGVVFGFAWKEPLNGWFR